MRASRTFLLAGVALMAAAQAATLAPSTVAQEISDRLGPPVRTALCPEPGRYACPVRPAILLLAAGALLAALAVRGAPTPAARPVAVMLRAVVPVWPRAAAASIAILVTLLAVTVAYFKPGPSVIVAWLVCIAVPLAWVAAMDRRRGTSLGWPSLDRREALLLAALTIANLVYVAHDLAHWRWAGTPDEAHFFLAAKGIAQGHFTQFPLSERGVFGYHPVLSSVYQAAFMKVFGLNVFAWRLSSAAALALSLPCLYVLARQWWGVPTAFVAVALFGFGQLPMAFAHFGYNNTQVYPLMLGGLAMLLWAMRRDSLTGYYLAGVIAGLGFYTFYASRITVLFQLLLAAHWWGWRGARRHWRVLILLLLGTLIVALPILSNPREVLSHLVRQSAVGGLKPVAAGDVWSRLAAFVSAETLQQLGQQWLVAIAHPIWTKGDHFLTSVLVDRVTGAAAAVGLWLALFGRPAGVGFVAGLYLLSALLFGATAPYEWPPNTRLLCLSPFTALLAAAALHQIGSALPNPGRRWLAPALAVLAVAWNLATQRDAVTVQYHGYGNGKIGELMRLIGTLPPATRIVILDDGSRAIESPDMILDEYGLLDRLVYLRPAQLPDAARTVRAVPPPFVVVAEVRDERVRRAVELGLIERFGAVQWRDSAPGRHWSLRNIYVDRGDEGARRR